MSRIPLWIWIAGGLFLLGIGGAMAIPTRIRRLAWAIANAERGPDEINSGVVVRNNPGDLKDITTGDLASYDTLQDGWNALYHQVELFYGGSAYYSPDMTINRVAQIYVGTSDWPNWARNVAAYLGVSPETRLNELT